MISASNIALVRDGRTIINDFSLEVQPGKVHALLGPNGSGKSTALSALAGDSNFYSGDISYDGIDARSLSTRELAKIRSVVSQGQKFGLGFSVKEILAMATTFSGSVESIDYAIATVDIESLLDRSVISLSGGEQQRVAIAMALAQSAKYLLLDEPFSAQDVGSVGRISSKLRELANSGVGILLVAHMAKEELTWCDEVTQLSARPQ
jgi:ABC-type cobalamin/Fe3+-siderophores transport system ATPase subunit